MRLEGRRCGILRECEVAAGFEFCWERFGWNVLVYIDDI
jgi:hypothetical protein